METAGRRTKTAGRRTLIVLSFVLVVVMLGYGMVIPIFPFYIERLGGSGREMGILVALAALTELLFGPMWGSLSDRVGRKPVLAVGIFGYALSLVLMGLAQRMWMLVAGRALSGVLSSATMPTAMAYVGESTSEEERGGGIGILGSAAGLGVILGPGIGGWLGSDSLSLPFFIGAGLAFVALLLVGLLLPRASSQTTETTDQASEAPADVPEKARRLQTILRPRRIRRALRGPAGFPLLLLFIVSFGLANFEAVFGLYAAQKFGYGPERVGTIIVVIGVVTTLGKGLLTGPLTKRWGEGLVIKGSMLAGAIGYLVLLAAYNYVTVLLATGLFILSKTVLRPALLSLISKRSDGELGAMMGLGNTSINLGRVVGPVWAGFAFDLNIRYPYLSGAGVLALGFLVSILGLAGCTGGSNP
ncbi:MAG: MFS transporter [Anaerolineae bacterium]